METTLLTDLISYWRMNEPSGVRYDAYGTNNLADNASVLYGTGIQGSAADFEVGNSEFLNIADNATLSFGDEDFTIAGWFNIESIGADRWMISKDDAGDSEREYLLGYQHASTRFAFAVSGNGTDITVELADVLGAPNVATWYFIVAWHDATANTINIQVNNGTADSGAHTTGCNDNVTQFVIGGRTNSGAIASPFDGLIDEVGMWNRVLTADEKTELYNAGNGTTYPFIFSTSGLGEDLISYWELNEESGQRFDRHGANDLTDNNSVLYDTGKQGNAGKFVNANDEDLSRTSETSLQTGDIDYTIACWVYLDNLTGDQNIVTKDDGDNDREYYLQYNDGVSDRFRFVAFEAVDSGVVVTDSKIGLPDTATWYFIIAWHDATANTINIQINDGDIDSQATGAALQAAGTAAFSIGAKDHATKLGIDGRVDEVGFWKRTLTADEKTALYNGGAGVAYDDLLISDAKAHGGVVTQDGNNIIHTFLEDGVFVAEESFAVEALVVAGGGGGGGGWSGAGGGGAGGLVYDASQSISIGSKTVTIGAGGAGGVDDEGTPPHSGDDGVDSVFDTITAVGGGAGDGSQSDGNPGGCGGGGMFGQTGGAATQGDSGGGTGYGFAGGDGGANSDGFCGGGGGGTSEVGENGNSATKPGDGGDGKSYSISGGAVNYGGGGGGGRNDAGTIGSGGAGGGGDGAHGIGDNATANTGGGGGGGGSAYDAGGDGGSGIVIISYSLISGRTSTKMAGF